MSGRILAIGLALIIVLGCVYAFWTLNNEKVMHDGREEALKTELASMRGAIRNFKADKGRGPHSLEELTPAYLRRVPSDPVTHLPNWRLDTETVVTPSNDFGSTTSAPPQSYVLDVHSAAGPPWSEY
jgi:hypothetical protein